MEHHRRPGPIRRHHHPLVGRVLKIRATKGRAGGRLSSRTSHSEQGARRDDDITRHRPTWAKAYIARKIAEGKTRREARRAHNGTWPTESSAACGTTNANAVATIRSSPPVDKAASESLNLAARRPAAIRPTRWRSAAQPVRAAGGSRRAMAQYSDHGTGCPPFRLMFASRHPAAPVAQTVERAPTARPSRDRPGWPQGVRPGHAAGNPVLPRRSPAPW